MLEPGRARASQIPNFIGLFRFRNKSAISQTRSHSVGTNCVGFSLGMSVGKRTKFNSQGKANRELEGPP